MKACVVCEWFHGHLFGAPISSVALHIIPHDYEPYIVYGVNCVQFGDAFDVGRYVWCANKIGLLTSMTSSISVWWTWGAFDCLLFIQILLMLIVHLYLASYHWLVARSTYSNTQRLFVAAPLLLLYRMLDQSSRPEIKYEHWARVNVCVLHRWRYLRKLLVKRNILQKFELNINPFSICWSTEHWHSSPIVVWCNIVLKISNHTTCTYDGIYVEYRSHYGSIVTSWYNGIDLDAGCLPAASMNPWHRPFIAMDNR